MDSEETNKDNVPLFILKLRKLIDEGEGGDIVYWSNNGKNFIINDQNRFAKEKLPLYFKHNNMASFIRQLNMYGFNKVTKIDNTGINQNYNSVEFYHPLFSKSQKSQLKLIKRKLNKGNVTNYSKMDEFQNIMMEVESMKEKQDKVDKMLLKLKEENDTLWREIAILRQKHIKQQQLVDKLLRFLVDIVRNSMSLKRKAPLMLDTNRKILKTNDNAIYLPSTSSNGPIIRDITEEDNSSLPLFKDFQIDFPKFIDEDNKLEMKNDTLNNNEEYNKKQKDLIILQPQQNYLGIQELLGIEGPDNNYFSALNTPTISLDDSDNNIINNLSTNINNNLNSNNNNNINNNNNNKINNDNNINEIDDNTNIINNNINLNDNSNNFLIPTSNSNSNNSISKFSNEDFNDHVDIIDAQLEWLKNHFNPGNFNLDSSLYQIYPLNNNQQLTDSADQTSTSDFMPKAIMDSDENEKIKLEENSNIFHFNEKGYLNFQNNYGNNDLIQTDILSDLTADINSSNF